MAKTIVIAAAALLLGILLGGIGPRAELNRTRAALVEAEAKAKRGGQASALPWALGLGSLAAARARAGGDGEGTDREGVRRVPRFETAPAAPAPGSDAADAGNPDRRKNPLRDAESFAMARTAQELRASQYRSAFAREAGLSPAAQAALEATIKQMNSDLAVAADEIAKGIGDKLARQEKPNTRDFADVGAKVLDIYRRADDAFAAGLDENARRAMAKTDFDLLTQIDLGAFERLTGTMQKLEANR